MIPPKILNEVEAHLKEILSTVSNPSKLSQWDRAVRYRLISCIILGIDSMLQIEMNLYPSLQQNPSPKIDEMRAMRMEFNEWRKTL